MREKKRKGFPILPGLGKKIQTSPFAALDDLLIHIPAGHQILKGQANTVIDGYLLCAAAPCFFPGNDFAQFGMHGLFIQSETLYGAHADRQVPIISDKETLLEKLCRHLTFARFIRS